MAITANSSERLAKELDRIGQPELARRARMNEFHDFLSDHVMPAMTLAAELGKIMHRSASAAELRKRVMDGEFDAPEDEAEDWAGSTEGQQVFKSLLKGA